MALNLPKTAAEVAARSKADIQRELKQSDPYLKNHWLLAIVVANANRVFDFYINLKRAVRELFPDTASGTFLTRWAAIWGKTKTPASQASGNVVLTGLAGYTAPSGTSLANSTGVYTATESATLASSIISVSSITRAGSTATVTTTSDHGLANNVQVTIAGAGQTEYNVSNTTITVTGSNTFTFAVSGTPVSPATGTITAAYTAASLPVTSDAFGAETNLVSGSELRLQSPIIGIDDTAVVDYGEIGGGTAEEDDESLRSRMLDRIQNPVAHFSEFDIIDKAKEVPGVTRVFVNQGGDALVDGSVTSITRSGNLATVTTSAAHGLDSGADATILGSDQSDYNGTFEILVTGASTFVYVVSGTPATPATGTILYTGQVALGTARVYFTRDNDDSIIPAGSEVAKVSEKLATIRPANTADTDVLVAAPVAVTVDFTFSDVTPNTSGIRTAINANIKQFFRENTTVGQNIDQDAYRAAIFNSVDLSTGSIVKTFTLASPTTDIAIAPGEIGVLGNITYT